MPEPGGETPLDLSLFDDLKPATPEPESATVVRVARETALADPRLAPEPPPPRLVEVAKLSPDELAAAEQACEAPPGVNYSSTRGTGGVASAVPTLISRSPS